MRILILIFISFLLKNELYCFATNRAQIDSISGQGRSLKDILEQYGKPLSQGKIVFTADGVLTEESPNCETLIKLQRKLAELVLLKDVRLIEDLLPKYKSKGGFQFLILVRYIQEKFGKEKNPLLAFCSMLLEEQKIIDSVRVDNLNLMHDQSCRADCIVLAKQINDHQINLLELEQMLYSLWQELLNFLPESLVYASVGE